MSDPTSTIAINQIMNQLDVAEQDFVTSESSVDKLCQQLRNTFHSINQLRRYKYTPEVKFEDYMKDRILSHYSQEDISIIAKWRNLTKYNRERTPEESLIIRKKNSIHGRVIKRYKYILKKAYGPVCGKCKNDDRKSYYTNCTCKMGVCYDCLKESCTTSSTDKKKYNCYECAERITIFIDLQKKPNSLKSLFNMNEEEYDSVKDDQYLQIRPSKKQKTQASSTASSSSSSPTPAEEIQDQVANDNENQSPAGEMQDRVANDTENHSPAKEIQDNAPDDNENQSLAEEIQDNAPDDNENQSPAEEIQDQAANENEVPNPPQPIVKDLEFYKK